MSTRHSHLQTEQCPFLPSGLYLITNVRYGVSLCLPDRRDELCGSLRSHSTWKVFNDSDARWYIQGGAGLWFAHRWACPRAGNPIIASQDRFGWVIGQCHAIRNPDCYLIFAISDHPLLWGLPDGEEQTPVTLHKGETNSKNWWRFQRIPDGNEALLSSPAADLSGQLAVMATTGSGASSPVSQALLHQNKPPPADDTGITEASDKPPAIIAIMGPSGVGKTSFINQATGETLPVGHGLHSCSQEVGEVGFKRGKRDVVLVDTPGFDDVSLSVTDILRLIATHLITSHKAGTKLTGVIYMHRITAPRVTGASLRSFAMIRKLCGSANLQQVAIVTTFWDIVDTHTAESREKELKAGETLFKPMLDQHADIMRYNGTIKCAQDIVDHFLQVEWRVQRQLIVYKMSTPVTTAGEVFDSDPLNDGRRYPGPWAAVQDELERATGPPLEEERFRFGSPVDGHVPRHVADMGTTWFGMSSPISQTTPQQNNPTPSPHTQASEGPPAIIAVVGETGAGKTSFINTVTGNVLPVAKGLKPCTMEIKDVWLKRGKRDVVLMDTPGFDDVTTSVGDVLKLIATHLTTEHNAGKLTGVIYLHRISNLRPIVDLRLTFPKIRKLCGSVNLQQVTIVTTFWDVVDTSTAESREKELRMNERLFMFSASMMRHNGTIECARDIVDHFLGLESKMRQLIVD